MWNICKAQCPSGFLLSEPANSADGADNNPVSNTFKSSIFGNKNTGQFRHQNLREEIEITESSSNWNLNWNPAKTKKHFPQSTSTFSFWNPNHQSCEPKTPTVVPISSTQPLQVDLKSLSGSISIKPTETIKNQNDNSTGHSTRPTVGQSTQKSEIICEQPISNKKLSDLNCSSNSVRKENSNKVPIRTTDKDIIHKFESPKVNHQEMDVMDDQPQTEYKRQFQWSMPMVEPKQIKPEPLMSQYQLAFGVGGSSATNSTSQPNSLTNSYCSSNHSNDITESVMMSTSLTNYRSISAAASSPISVTPGSAIRTTPVLPLPSDRSQSPVVNGTVTPTSTQQRSPQNVGKVPQPPSLKSTSSLFDYEPPPRSPSPFDPVARSEYYAKFKDFNEYVYVEGDGFKKVNDPSLAANKNAQQIAQSWFNEVKERSQQACKYRARSRNGAAPVNPDYSWNGVAQKDHRELQALALATRLLIQEKKSEKDAVSASTGTNSNRSSRTSSGATARSASARPLSRQPRSTGANPAPINTITMNSAPPSLHDSSSIGSKSSAPIRPVVRKSTLTAKTSTTTTVSVPGMKSLVDKNNNNTMTTTTKATRSTSMKVGQKAKMQPVVTTTTTTTIDGKTSPLSNKVITKKIWIKPAKKASNAIASTNAANNVNQNGGVGDNNYENDNNVDDYDSLANVNQNDNKSTNASATAIMQDRKFDSEPKAVPLHTTQIKSPEEMTGIKSPSPESWKVTIEKGGLNWVNGNTPVNFGDGKLYQHNNDNMVKPVPINASINDDFYGPLSA